MKKQVEKLVVLLGVAGAFVLMSFNEPRWFDKAVGEETYWGGLVIDVNLMKMICR